MSPAGNPRRRRQPSVAAHALAAWPLTASLAACGAETDSAPAPAPPTIRVVTFNTGTSPSMGNGPAPNGGYGGAEAAISDQYYGNGLAFSAVVDDARAYLAGLDAEIVHFQEIFYSGECAGIDPAAKAGFVCESWQPGDPTVAEVVLGAGYQVACNLDKPDKCAAVKLSFGHFRGCDGSLCLDGLDGAEVPGCGSGSRIGRGVIELEGGGTLTVVNVHGTSGLDAADQGCRLEQFEQVFVDLGDGEPAASGSPALIMGDFNTDPGRMAGDDPSAAFVAEQAAAGARFHFVSEVGPTAPGSYAGLFDIDHVLSDTLEGGCFIGGLDGRPPVTDVRYFDHEPVVCDTTLP